MKPLRGALKNKGEKVYTTASNSNISLTPGTFFTNGATGIGKRGIDLDRSYNGEFNANGQRHGYGMYQYANGYLTYEGDYKNGVKHGNGKLTNKDGGYFEGRFDNDEIQGMGTRKFANGNSWTGMFQTGDMHGPGTMQFSNGDRFEGLMDLNRMQGMGVYRYKNGDHYRGEFVGNRMTGSGTMAYRNGDRYKGAWLNGKRHGRGRCSYATGDHYTGEWQHDSYNGNGSMVYSARGIHYEGHFIDGQPSKLPTKLNIFWHGVADDKAKLAAKKVSGKGSEEPLPLLANVLGIPLALPLTVSAQLTVSTEDLQADVLADLLSTPAPTSSVNMSTPAVKTSSSPVRKAGVAIGGPAQLSPVMTERAPAGQQWLTSDMEYGHVVWLTLHHALPQPVSEDRPVGVQLVHTLLADGTTQMRVLLAPLRLGPALPMQRLPGSSDPVRCIEVTLEQGKHVFAGLSLGDVQDFDVLQCPDGVGYLVATCGWGLQSGYCRVALPDSKAKNPNPTPTGKK